MKEETKLSLLNLAVRIEESKIRNPLPVNSMGSLNQPYTYPALSLEEIIKVYQKLKEIVE